MMKSTDGSDSASSSGTQPPKILWSCVTRNETILAEATEPSNRFDRHAVAQTARELLARKPTPGFEFHTQNRLNTMISKATRKSSPKKSSSNKETNEEEQQQQQESSHKQSRPLKGIKFHVYEHINSRDDIDETTGEAWKNDDTSEMRIWVYCAVYDPEHAGKREVQSFLEKIVTITEPFRDDVEWRSAQSLDLQLSFAPVLQQRMEEVTYLGKMAMLQDSVQACQTQMEANIHLILERGEKLEDLNDEATHMQEMSKIFKKRAKKVKKMHLMKNAKYGMIAGTAGTALTAAIVIPPLVAML